MFHTSAKLLIEVVSVNMAYDKIKAIKWFHIYKNLACQKAMNFYGPNDIVSKMHKAKTFPVIQG